MKNTRNFKSETISGRELSVHLPNQDKLNSICNLKGKSVDGIDGSLSLSLDVLSKHVLLMGGIGTGKTNTFNGIISQIQKKMTDKDVMIIFDTKGDFYSRFYKPGDVVISTDETATGSLQKDYWNIFNEISRDSHIFENITEIAKMLFAEVTEKTNQVFFPNAARGLFEAIIFDFIMSRPKECSNYYLMDFINRATAKDIRELLLKHKRYRAMLSYISADDSAQTQGVLSELQQVTRDILIGNFSEVGYLALRDLVREKQGKTIFIEYDLSVGKALTPIYSLMFDLAIKEALSRKRSEGNVYFITDEFRLLPYLEHIDDAVNFGRSLGVKFLIGLQNIEQIYGSYGEERARSILSGFQTIISFYLNDEKSRDYVKGVFGKNRKIESYLGKVQSKGVTEETRDAYVIEDWDITQLRTGEAIIGLPELDPFIFKFDYYGEEE